MDKPEPLPLRVEDGSLQRPAKPEDLLQQAPPKRKSSPAQVIPPLDSAPIEALKTDPLVSRYLDHVRFEKRLAERTCTLYQLDLKRLAEMAAATQVPLLQVHSGQVRRWVAQMHSAGRSGRGIALILSGWRGFYTWLGREGLIAQNPMADVRAPRVAKPLPKALGVDEAVQLAEHEEQGDDPWLEARDAAMVELLYGCGLRIAELTGLDVLASTEAARAGRGWIDLANAEVQVQGKGSKRRTVPLGRAATEALTHWLAVRPQLTGMLSQAVPGASSVALALFPGRHGTRLKPRAVAQRLKRRSLLAGLATPVHPHMLRHSFASHVLQSSGDLRAVQELLGHANIRSTQVYTRLDFQHLAKTYDAAHPRAKRK